MDGDKADGARRLVLRRELLKDAIYMATKAAKKSGKQKRKESRRLVLPREDAKAVDKYSRRERRTATRRLVLRRELLKDAIYMATKAAKKSGKQKRKESRRLVLPREDAKAVDKYSRRERRTADGGRRQEGWCCAESYSRTPSTWLPRLSNKYSRRERRTADGDKKARAAQRATQGRNLHGYQGCRQVQQERTADGRRRTANSRRERRQEGLCCAESCLRMPRELATVKRRILNLL